jgi:adenylosuccinate synthase
MQRHNLIIDCQYGSTGKGLYAGYLASKCKPSVIAFAPSPNAGHTLLLGEHSYIHKMLPTGITSDALETVCLGPGSLIDLDRLQAEIYRQLPELQLNPVSVADVGNGGAAIAWLEKLDQRRLRERETARRAA